LFCYLLFIYLSLNCRLVCCCSSSCFLDFLVFIFLMCTSTFLVPSNQARVFHLPDFFCLFLFINLFVFLVLFPGFDHLPLPGPFSSSRHFLLLIMILHRHPRLHHDYLRAWLFGRINRGISFSPHGCSRTIR